MDIPEVTKMMDEMNDNTAEIRADRDRLQALNAELVAALEIAEQHIAYGRNESAQATLLAALAKSKEAQS